MALICSSKLLLFFFIKQQPRSDISYFSLIFFLVCNEVPEEPVLSPVSNNVFERRLIVKYIHENGTDPINGEPLTEDQLLEIKGRCNKNEREGRESGILINAHLLNFSHAANPLVKPRPPSATSIPAILKLLQDEWVCIMQS